MSFSRVDNRQLPIDTAGVTLTAEALTLAQGLAKNSHSQWVQALTEMGWIYGPQLNDTSRTHPYLVRFEELPEAIRNEKLQVFLEQLKVAMAMGYSLQAPNPASDRSASTPSSQQQVSDLITDASLNLQLAPLMALRRDIVSIQPRTPDLHCSLADTLLQLGEPLMAYDVLMEGLHQWPQHLRLQQLLALALARSGAIQSANQLLLKLVESGQRDEETLGLLARTHKDLWRQSQSSTAAAVDHLSLALQRYQEAYAISRSPWPGINAATLALVQGDIQQAQALAQTVRDQSQQALAKKRRTGGDPYWVLATLGEAELILGHWDEAEVYYAEAVKVGQGRYGDLSSTYRNARLLIQATDQPPDWLQRWFQMPRVVVFSGHRVDAPQRSQPRFPPELEGPVYAAIMDKLQGVQGTVGYASASCGSDILFLEAILALGGECNVVLPYARDQFVQHSVEVGAAGNWVNRFEQVLSRAREIVIASDARPKGDATSYEYSNRLLHGLARMRARQLHTDLVPLAVWNGQPGDGRGGTASTVAYWRQWTPHVEIIDLAEMLRQHCPQLLLSGQSQASPQRSLRPPEDNPREVRALLFADVVHFTQLSEDKLLTFMQHFLKAVAELSQDLKVEALMKNTWGDALYYVFATVQEAGEFALALCDLMQTMDWQAAGLQVDMNLRIALHAGPVFRGIDPVTGQVNYIGTHVNYAARIEPVTPPGKVYASQAFAAIAASEGVESFSCDYVGQMPWAKHYGTFATYHVHR